MAISTIRKTKRDGKITLRDNAAAHTLEVAFEAGDLNITIPKTTVSLELDRGSIGSPPDIRYGDDAPITGTFTARLRDLSDAAYATLESILMESGFVSTDWVSTMGANGEVFTLDILWEIEGTDHGDATDHSLILPYCYITGSLAEGDSDIINISFTSYAVLPTSIT